MSKKFLIASLICLLHAPVACAQSGPFETVNMPSGILGKGQPLKISFTSVTPENGKIWVGVCTEDQMTKRYRGDDMKCAAEAWLDATENSKTSFDDLMPGVYAITAFHDENDNSKLDFDTRGIPFEATGNGNNAKGNYGPPTFKQMKFSLPDASAGSAALTFNIDFYRAGPPF